MNLGIHPFILLAALGVVAALVAAGLAFWARSKIAVTTWLVLAFVFCAPAGLVLLAWHPGLTDGRFRTYKAFYGDISLGMTREEVFAALDRRYPTDKTRKRPKVLNDTPGGLGFFMDPETSTEPNCEGIFLTMNKGRVTQKIYSPD